MEENSTKAVLLQGVTGSGKTMLYIELIKDCLNQGRQALFMLPEIALTTQMIRRIRQYFNCPIECIIHGFLLPIAWNSTRRYCKVKFQLFLGALKCFSAL